MHIKSIYLERFRNYRSLELEFGPGALLFDGPNGAGKTNLLESVYFLSMCRSFRFGPDRDVVQRGSAGTLIRAEAFTRDGAASFAMEYSLDPPAKRAFINGNPVSKIADYVGSLKVVAFHPGDLEIIKGPPSLRRRFLDHWLSQEDRAYIYDLKRFYEALAQRNALLKRHGPSARARPEFGGITETMVEAGSAIIATRKETLDALSGFVSAEYARVAGEGEDLTAEYRPAVLGGEEPDIFRETLLASAAEEARFKQTLAGPHRDDITLTVSGTDARRFASQGQQRSTALALRLAQFRMLADRLGDTPVLLLDDAFSELDRERAEHVEEAVSNAEQTWITATKNAPGLPGTRFRITDGKVNRL